MTSATVAADLHDFSLVLGGPLFRILRRTWLCGEGLELARRRIVALCSLTWLPLFVLAAVEGNAWGAAAKLPFLLDAEVHVRFLVALPLLLVAELVVHRRMQPVVRQFIERRIIPEAALPQFDAALASATRLRNSVLAELVLFALVYGVGVLVLWRQYMALDVWSWYGVMAEGRLQPSLAGWWFGCVSLPLFQFLLLRWYFRLFVWARFLWQVSRIELDLVPTHPDQAAGLGFLALTSYAFTPLLLAQGALVAGMMANRIFFVGAKLPDFKLDVAGVVAFMVVAVLGPLLVFSPRLERAKRTGMREYGTLALRYTREFDRKWLRGGADPAEPFLGSADIQSLADLGNSFEAIKNLRFIPFPPRAVVHLAVVTAAPVLPLLLTMLSFEELLQRLLNIVF
jgi:hypothetical protein